MKLDLLEVSLIPYLIGLSKRGLLDSSPFGKEDGKKIMAARVTSPGTDFLKEIEAKGLSSF